MQKFRVVAADITNLTDARYFAAHGVEYLLFNLDEIAAGTVVEIKEWVSGPQTLVVIGDDSIHQIDEALLRIKPDFFTLLPGTNYDASHLLPHFAAFNYESDDEGLRVLIDHQLFVQVPPFLESPSSWLREKAADGFVVRGSPESHTGIKSYDMLDQFFEKISDD